MKSEYCPIYGAGEWPLGWGVDEAAYNRVLYALARDLLRALTDSFFSGDGDGVGGEALRVLGAVRELVSPELELELEPPR